ncbi:hypothetical protein [Streptomyces sp. NPDC047043]|uniref:hypothetical protein n=1 Tax=Streptomyces sp. NPDC047043 TaxID=3154497 RepID=UPI00340FD13E
MISDRGPDTDATVVRYGLRWLLWTLPLVVLMGATSVGAVLLVFLERRLYGLLLLPGLVWSVLALRTALRRSRLVTVLDAHGFWVLRGRKTALVPWDSLAGVGLYWTRVGRARVCTVELCPRGDIDRDDAVLWEFVRDAAPLREGLPRLRHRIDVLRFPKVYDAALRRWAPPGLWFGWVEQPGSYVGQPDRAGHRQRTRAARFTRPEP